jgi:hypothetical protein
MRRAGALVFFCVEVSLFWHLNPVPRLFFFCSSCLLLACFFRRPFSLSGADGTVVGVAGVRASAVGSTGFDYCAMS